MVIKGILLVVTYAVTVFGGTLFVKPICKKLELSDKSNAGLTGAGRYIGYLERFIVLTLLLVGQYEAIAFIFAGKSIARFARQTEVEYYLVGTLASLSWTIFWGMALRWVLAMLQL
jgi:hypothetical protein